MYILLVFTYLYQPVSKTHYTHLIQYSRYNVPTLYYTTLYLVHTILYILTIYYYTYTHLRRHLDQIKAELRDLSLSYEKLRTDSAKEIMKWQSLVASGNITNHTTNHTNHTTSGSKIGGHNSDLHHHHRKPSPSRSIGNNSNTPSRSGGHNSDRKGSENEINLLRRKIITLERQLQIEKNSNNTNNSKHTSYTTSHSYTSHTNTSIRDRDRNRYVPIDSIRPPSVPRTNSRQASPSYHTNNNANYNTHSNNYSSNIRSTSSRGRSDTPPPRRPSPTYTNNNNTHNNNIHSTNTVTNSSRPTSRTRPAQYIESLSRQGTPTPISTSYRSRSASPQIQRERGRGHNSEGKPAWGSRPNLSRASSRYVYILMLYICLVCVVCCMCGTCSM